MNQRQRQFIVDKLTEKSKHKIQELESQKPKAPSISNYLYLALMNGTLKLKSEAEILEALKQKALAASENTNWMSEESIVWGPSGTTVKVHRDTLFILPDNYVKALEAYRVTMSKVQAEIDTLKLQVEGLIVRVQLASAKNLNLLLSEVDDMGAISLLDTKLKKLM